MKYIDADKLKELLKERQEEKDYREVIWLIDSLQQEQPVEGQEQPVSPKDKFVFPNFLYARTVDNKTIDVSYVPQSLNAVEYVKNNPIGQPVEGLEEEISRTYHDGSVTDTEDIDHTAYENIARHFAEWQKSKMLEGAVEGKVFMSFAPGHNQMVMADVDLPTNTKVKVIIVKEGEK